MHPTQFPNTYELAQLPWFEQDSAGRLRMCDESVGPIIDVHTHLALSFLFPNRVDLKRRTEKTEHYLPLERALDLNVYMNRNLKEEDLSNLKRDLTLGSLTAGGMRGSHTLGNLAREMEELGVSHCCILPIELPVLSNNARNHLQAAKNDPQFIGFGSIHPFSRNLEERLERQIALGAQGIKVHPAVQLVGPEHPRAQKLYRLCGKRSLPVLWHCGPVDIETRMGRKLSQVKRYREPIEKCPETTFILGHSGALQMEEALELAMEFPNVYLELSCQGLPNIRKILASASPERLLFGTDWPFYHQAPGIAKILMASENDEELRRAVFSENAIRLFGLD